MQNELSGKRAQALELHNKILVSAQLAQTNLWEMCSGLKEMRDGKLYKELGYQNFEDYCESEFNISRMQALELHNKILVSAQLAQTNLWEMCSGLKEMRDGKLYKELGYQNFEEYCELEHGFSRQHAHRYISIIENIKKENVTSGLHFGMKKLYLLSTLSESEQAEITGKIDVENTTVKELEQDEK